MKVFHLWIEIHIFVMILTISEIGANLRCLVGGWGGGGGWGALPILADGYSEERLLLYHAWFTLYITCCHGLRFYSDFRSLSALL